MSTFLDEVLELTAKARQQRNTFYHVPPAHLDEPRGLYGRDAGADYANSVASSVKEAIKSHAEGKSGTMVLQTNWLKGPGSREGFVETMKTLLPGFRVEDGAHGIVITWAEE